MSRSIHPQTICMYTYFWVTQVRKKEQKDKLASQTSTWTQWLGVKCTKPLLQTKVHLLILAYILQDCVLHNIYVLWCYCRTCSTCLYQVARVTLPQTLKEIHATVVPLIMLKHTCKTQPILETQRNIMQPTLARSCPKNRYLAWAFFMEVLASVFVYVCVCICTCRRV